MSLIGEAANLDIHAIALAAHNSGGKVIAQVRHAVEAHSLPARQVNVPGVLVDAVVVDPDQRTGYDIAVDPALSGERRGIAPGRAAAALRRAPGHRPPRGRGAASTAPWSTTATAFPTASRSWSRCAATATATTSRSSTAPTAARCSKDRCSATRATPSAIIDAPSQFDFYSGGGLDIAFLGFGQIDAAGNVNVSKLAGLPVGPGGFIDIAQNARKVVFCGTFDTKGASARDRRRPPRDRPPRRRAQARARVDQITFSGPQALRQGQEVVYVTERAVFRLTAEGVALVEIAPGVDLARDVLARMEFRPAMPQPPATMAAAHFEEADRFGR